MNHINEFNLISTAEVAEMFGITRARVSQLANDGAFPPPVYRQDRVITLWLAADITRWGIEHSYLEVH